MDFNIAASTRAFLFSIVTSLFIFNFASICRASDLLHKAIEKNELSKVIELLDSGIDVNTRVENNRYNTSTALHTASWFGHKEIVVELLKRSADVTLVNQCGQTALFQAAYQGHATIVQLLLENGAKEIIDQKETLASKTPLGTAMAGYHMATATILIINGANVNFGDHHGHTPLHSAASGGYIDMVKLLIDRGANVNAAEYGANFTPLHAAGFMGKKDVMKILIAHGADQEVRNWNKRTAEDMLQEYNKRHK